MLVADIGHEIPADFLHPASLGLVLGQQQDQATTTHPGTQRGHPHGEARGPAAELGARDLDLTFPDLAVPAYLASQGQ